jgi:hypothetical protein
MRWRYTVWMYSRIKILRRHGARLAEREIIGQKGHDGELTLYRSGGWIELKLSEPNDQRKEPIVPILYDAKLVTMHGDRMLFQGMERTGDEKHAQYMQEWSVMLLP